MNMNHQRDASVMACGPCFLLHRHYPSLPSAHHKNCIFFPSTWGFLFLKSKEKKQKMLGANGGRTISPHNPLWCPFAIDQILSTLQFSMQAKNKGGEHLLHQCVTRR
ncbi:hypothetical protein SORBI_3001G197050 [Sorghum bicolor]|uniref:Uncharacterized protein n=1 Tax=Sorghum bicolor TaxID=4558 RepID=A0A1Z5S6G3_SORBI|nr:hypothetical protein SORBI_3001G197050 [Sorghum bicolor]